MAIVLNHNPGTYFSAHDKLIFTVFEAAKYANTNYKYLCDVYIGGVMINRLTAWPDPDNGRGIFEIQDVVRDYVAANFNPTSNVIKAQEMGSGEFFIDVQCKFGENDNGTVTSNLLVDSSRRYYNHYNGRLVGDTSTLDGYLDKPLTTRPLTDNTVEVDDDFCFLPFFPTDTDPYTVTIGFPAGGSYSVPYTPSAANTLQLLNISPGAINAIYGSALITSSIEYYTVKINTPNIADEPTYRFDVVCEAIYTTYKLHFLNRFGGFETFPFRKVSRKEYGIERKSYTQKGYAVDGSGVVTYYNANNVYKEQKTVYASHFTEKLKVTSDWITDDQFTWLRDIAVSTNIYLEENGYFIPVTIDSSTYEEKKRVNDQLQLLQFNIELPGTYNAQFR